MCGILYTDNHNITKEQFLSALALQDSRGPDSTGFYQYKNFKLGCKRLKVQDKSIIANMPFVIGNHVIIYNGEIYNFKELKKKYKLETRTKSDTEVLLLLYKKLGSKCLDELNGAFAFVIFDKRKEEVFIARDRLGIKPLYRCARINTYSSSIASLLLLNKSNDIDDTCLAQYLKMRAVFHCETLYSGIQEFPPATYENKRDIKRYWGLRRKYETPPKTEELRELITSAIKLRMISDVPVGCLLSGGLDSSIIALTAKKLQTYSVGFVGKNNEFEWSDIVADNLKTAYSKVLITKEIFEQSAKELILKKRHPISVPNEVLLYVLSKTIKQRNTVVLSGEGADESFYGYNNIFTWARDSTLSYREFSDRYGYNPELERLDVVKEAIYPYISSTTLETVSKFFITSHLKVLLERLDFATMCHGVEARVPFCDHRIVERVYGLPFHWKKNKKPLKHCFKNIVPEQVINRKKIGFPVPISYPKWLQYNIDILQRKDVSLWT